MLRKFICAFLVLSCLGCSSGNWPYNNYSSVRVYYYNAEGLESAPIITNGKLNASVNNPEGAELSSEQTKKLLSMLRRTDLAVAACYEPRHAFVFFDREKSPVGYIEACLECLNYRFTPPIETNLDFDELGELIKDLNLPFGPELTYESFTEKLRYRRSNN